MSKEKKLSCGGLIFYGEKMLICRPRWDSGLWNLPKGVKEDDETTLDAAIREIKEETNISIDTDVDVITIIGRLPYLKKKDLFLFNIKLKEFPIGLKCNSFFERNGKQIPEMVDFKWVSLWDTKSYFSEKLNKSLSIIFGEDYNGNKY